MKLFGSNLDATGINCSIFSRQAPFQVIKLNPQINRTFYAWHVYVEDLPAGIWYNGHAAMRSMVVADD